MDRQERAELAVRLVGLAVVVYAAIRLVTDIVYVGLIAGKYPVDAYTAASVYVPQALQVLVGVALLAWPGAVSGWVVSPDREAEESAAEESLRLGLFAVGILCLLHALPYVPDAASVGVAVVQAVRSHRLGSSGSAPSLGPGFYGRFYLALAAWALPAAVFLAGPRRLIAWLAARVRAGEGWSQAGALGAGFALISLWRIGSELVHLPSVWYWQRSYNSISGWGDVYDGASLVRLRAYVGSGLAVACWLLVLAFCGRLSRWLARGAPESGRPVLSALEKESWFELALPAVVLWNFLAVMQWVLGQVHPATPAASWAMAAAAPVVVIAVVAAVGRWAPGLTHGSDGLPAQPTARSAAVRSTADRDAARVALEVAFMTITAYWLVSVSWSAIEDTFVGVAWFLTLALLLVLRGDIARWCAPSDCRAEEGVSRRQAALFPWLSLLAVVVLVDWAPAVATTIMASAGILADVPHSLDSAIEGRRADSLPWPQLAAGLLLIFARRPLSRLLAYGPVLQRRTIRHGLKSD